MNYIKLDVKTLLDSAMNAASLASSYKGKVDSLSFVRILVIAGGQRAFFSASNSAQTQTVGIELVGTNLTDETEVLISGAKMRQVLSGYKSLKAETIVTIEWTGWGAGQGVFKAGRSKLKVDTLDPGTFPTPLKINSKESGQAFSNYANLINAIKTTRHAIPTNDARYYLNGLNLVVNDSKLVFTGSDGHRLYRGSLENVNSDQPMNGIVPTVLLDMLVNTRAEADTPCRIRMDSQSIEVVVGNNLFRSNLIDGKYPNVDSFFANEPTWLAEVSAEEVMDALGRLQATADDTAPSVSLEFSGQEVALRTTAKSEVTGEDAITGKVLSKLAKVISFNIRYLMDAISANSVKSEHVSLGFNESSNFLVVKGKDSDSESIVMSMRV